MVRVRSSGLILGYREAVGLLIGAGMALIWGPILASQGTSALLQEYQFMTDSTNGIAEVVGKTRVGEKDFYVDCRLLSGVGATVYEKRLSVYSGLWQNLRKGQTINVDYLRTDPANMRLQGSIGNLGDSLAHLLLGSLLIVIAIMASIGGVECLAKEAARRANGQAPENRGVQGGSERNDGVVE